MGGKEIAEFLPERMKSFIQAGIRAGHPLGFL